MLHTTLVWPHCVARAVATSPVGLVSTGPLFGDCEEFVAVIAFTSPVVVMPVFHNQTSNLAATALVIL